MALRTKLNTNEDGTNDGLEDIDDLDVVYVDSLKNSGLDESLLEQFMDISKMLSEKEHKNSDK